MYLHLGNITILQDKRRLGVRGKRREMSNTVVDGNSSGETDTYVDVFFFSKKILWTQPLSMG